MVDLGPGKKVSTPFPAIVGRESLKRGLLALAVEDGLSGALVRGEKGTAKSTAVRAMADLLPEQRVVADCPYGCSPDSTANQCADCRERANPPVETRPTPLVTLPLGATRDRVVGTLSVADALEGDAEFDPGLLARANRGVLYVDEVNLLDDHLVDVLLDAAAMGTNRVERDGVSVTHPAEFTLIGTMNPEEGELRPQLRDRFDLCIEVTGSDDTDERVEILNRVVDDTDNDRRERFAEETEALRERIRAARDLRPEIPASFKRDIVELCRDAGVEGHRADFATARTARAFAALDGRPKVIESDISEAAEYALAHRLRSRPFEDAVDPSEFIDDRFGEDAPESDEEPDQAEDEEGNGEDDRRADREENDDGDGENNLEESDSGESESGEGEGDQDGSLGTPDQQPDGVPDTPSDSSGDDGSGDDGKTDRDDEGSMDGDGNTDDDPNDETAKPLVPGSARAGVGEAAAPEVEPPTAAGSDADHESGRSDATPSASGRGARVRTEPADGTGSVDAAASVRTAVRSGNSTPDENDLRQAVRTDDARTLTVFLTDASASMAPAMRAAKGVVLELLKDAYTERDEVALIAFGGEDAETVSPPTTSVTLAARHLKELPSADRTPLPAGLDAAAAMIDREAPDSALVVLVSDGRANVADGSPTAATRAAARRLGGLDPSVLVVDVGESRSGLLDVVCEATDADRVPLSALSPETVVGVR